MARPLCKKRGTHRKKKGSNLNCWHQYWTQDRKRLAAKMRGKEELREEFEELNEAVGF
jgi:hypothetical protein